jgi:hypothetical protein
MRSSPTLALVYVRWSENRGDAPLVALKEHLERVATSPIAVCVVDNRAGIPPIAAQISGLSAIAGHNSEREFSGYDAGIRHIRGCDESPDLWLLTNDRFDAYGLDDLELVNEKTLEVAASVPCSLGHVDHWPAPVDLLGFDVSSWARSNMIIIPERSLRSTGSLVSVDASTFSSLLPDSPPAEGNAANAALALRQNLGGTWSELTTEWLSGVGSRLHSHWYEAAPLDQWGSQAFRGKVLSIMNEQLLSARLRQSGTAVIPLPMAATLASLPATVRRLTNSAIRRWPTESVNTARKRGVARVGRSCASVESSIRGRLRRAGSSRRRRR